MLMLGEKGSSALFEKIKKSFGSIPQIVSVWGYVNGEKISTTSGPCHYALGSKIDYGNLTKFDSFFTGGLYLNSESHPNKYEEEVSDWLASKESPWRVLGEIEQIKNPDGATVFFHLKDLSSKDEDKMITMMNFCVASRLWRDITRCRDGYIVLRDDLGLSVPDSYFFSGFMQLSNRNISITNWDGGHQPFSYADMVSYRNFANSTPRKDVKGCGAFQNTSIWRGGAYGENEIYNKLRTLRNKQEKTRFSTIRTVDSAELKDSILKIKEEALR